MIKITKYEAMAITDRDFAKCLAEYEELKVGDKVNYVSSIHRDGVDYANIVNCVVEKREEMSDESKEKYGCYENQSTVWLTFKCVDEDTDEMHLDQVHTGDTFSCNVTSIRKGWV